MLTVAEVQGLIIGQRGEAWGRALTRARSQARSSRVAGDGKDNSMFLACRPRSCMHLRSTPNKRLRRKMINLDHRHSLKLP